MLVFLVFVPTATAATAPTAQDERALEILRDEKELRTKIEEGQKYYIEQINIKGSQVINKEDLDQLVVPFNRRWLTQKDIGGLVDSIEELYAARGKKPPEISWRMAQDTLDITLSEQ